MSERAGFLIGVAQALATMSLYRPGHPARERAIDAAYEALTLLYPLLPTPTFSFVGDEIVAGDEPVPELSKWEWSGRLARAGVERIEIDPGVTRGQLERFLDEVAGQLAGRGGTAEVRHLAPQPIRWGPLAVRGGGGHALAGPEGAADAAPAPSIVDVVSGAVTLSLADEAAAIGWIHGEVASRGQLPLAEVETVVRSLSLAMHLQRGMLMPLLELKTFDQYTTTHALNVAVLAMGLAEELGCSREEVRSFGVAGLLHDIGKVRIPHELLVKPGAFTAAERALVQRHPEDGARIILARQRGLGLAAVVAYEHHICLDGGGYPCPHWPRACHLASRIVHVCDVYDALCTDRPYRAAWAPERTLAYLEEKAGSELDPVAVRAFVDMVRRATLQRVAMPTAA